MAEQFTKSRHAQIFADLGSPGCATCHNNHDVKKPGDHMVGVTEGAVCATCHGADDDGGKVAAGIRTLLDRLGRAHDSGRAILLRAEHAGMEVSQPQFELNGAADALVKARAAVHTFTVGEVKQHADTGLAIAAKAEARGVRALEELDFRRKGLAASLVITLALIFGLVLKIREVDRRQVTQQKGVGGNPDARRESGHLP
jgi:predicted CXXCH cytochrome family protein